MMLKRVIVLLLICTVLVGSSLRIKQVTEITYLPDVAAKISSDPEKIANTLTAKYLKHYESRLLPDAVRLEDYSIKELKIFQVAAKSFVYTVKFSVKASSRTSNWVAGNGSLAPQGWIEDKFFYVTVLHTGAIYRVERMATSL
ncbi:MAG: hypothetical protein M0Z55_06385 [Peptococcaceae bacterium]|nr:hypothetical protein [Peptococcaceae bacterium]